MDILSHRLARSLAGALFFSLAGAAAWAQSGLAVPQAQGQQVVEVRVVSDNGEVLEENPASLPLRTGQPLAFDLERESLRQLFRTGDYADVVAEAATVAGGVRLDFVVRRNLYVNRVSITGLHEAPSDAVATSALQFGFGEIFRESDMPAALARLQQTMQDEGFYQAKLTYDLSPDNDTHQMDITVHVSPGPRARIAAINLTNETPFSEGELRRRLRLKPREEISAQQLDNGTERVRKFLVDRNYLGARVSLDRGAYDAKSNTVPLGVHLSAGFQVQIRTQGEKFSASTLRRLLPIYQEGAVDEDLLQEGRNNLRDYVQSGGYFNAEVNYMSSSEATPASPTAAGPAGPAAAKPKVKPAGVQIITYSVERGPRRRLAGIAFMGNQYFSDALLRSRLQIAPAAFAARGRFSSALLASDVASVAALYQANGFLQAQVTDEVVDNYRGHREDLFVRFHVTEGLQTRVAELTIEGNHAFTTQQLTAVIGSSPGQPFSDFNVTGDRDNVLALYYNQGFLDAQFRAITQELADPAGEGPRVSLTYHIEEGTQSLVSEILVSGFEHARLNVIRREVQLAKGQPLSEGAVVESQRRLYNLGIFSRISIAPQNPNGTDANKVLGVLVDEARRYTIGYGLGVEALRLGDAGSGPASAPLRISPRGTFEFTKLDLTGRADTLSFKMRASTLQGRALLSYTLPNAFDNPKLSWQFSGDYQKELDVVTFTSTRTEASVQLTDQITTASSVSIRYAYRHVLASNLQIEPEEIPLFSQPTRVSLIGGTWVRDRRDNPSDASRGSFNTLDVDVASRSFGSSASFVRTLLDNSTYTPIGKRFVFARSFRLGVETPVGGTVSTDIPLPERFFAGGGTTLRGFGLNQAGPRDPLTGFPIGGLGMLLFKQQLQFPMRLPFLGNHVGGAVFYDAGNVFSSFQQITLRLTPPMPVFNPSQAGACVFNCTNSMDYFAHTVGFELRYRTPVGPISIDLAYQLNAAHFLEPNGATLPNGTPGLQTAKLPAFQFFVNLGTTF